MPPGYGPPGYGPPGYGNHPLGQATNGFAIASLVLGIIGGVMCIGWILALVFGYIGRKQIDQSGGYQGGRGLATAGIVLGYVWASLLVIYILIIVIAAASSST
jgi:hypothetical protein